MALHLASAVNPSMAANDLFGKGGLFGPPDSSAADAQAAFLKRLMDRESALYPQVQDILGQTSGLEDQALSAETGALDSVYPTAMSELTTGKLPDDTAKWLASVRDSRLAGINAGAKSMVGDAVANLANRGVTSSSTAEGTYGQIAKNIEPSIDQAQADYANSMLTMPRQNASDMFNLASDYGSRISSALKGKRSDLLNPYLDMWKTSASIGSGTPATPPSNTAGAQVLGAILPAALSAA